MQKLKQKKTKAQLGAFYDTKPGNGSGLVYKK